MKKRVLGEFVTHRSYLRYVRQGNSRIAYRMILCKFMAEQDLGEINKKIFI